jgi:hypothetical protein
MCWAGLAKWVTSPFDALAKSIGVGDNEVAAFITGDADNAD